MKKYSQEIPLLYPSKEGHKEHLHLLTLCLCQTKMFTNPVVTLAEPLQMGESSRRSTIWTLWQSVLVEACPL